MALPPEFDSACVHGKYVNLDGTIPTGTVRFTGGILLRATTSDTVILPSAFTVTLSGTGQFTVILPTTDDPDITPFDWLYQVDEQFSTFTRSYYIEVPYDTVGCIEVADLEIPLGGNVAIERGRYVESIAGQVGEVTLAMLASGVASATTFLRGDGVWAVPAGSGGGVTDHGALTGLSDDDHPQYYNQSRGDARYVLLTSRGVASGVASLDSTARVPVAQLGSGAAGATVFLRGDGVWATPSGTGGVTDHGQLTGLTDDDHPQYHNDARGDARYVLLTSRGVASGVASLDSTTKVPRAQLGSGTPDATVFLRGDGVWATTGGSGGGVTDHGALTGLLDDDHPQYHNDARGDLRYVTLTQKGAASGVVPLDGSSKIATAYLPTYTISVAGRSGAVVLTKSDVGLNNVDNTTDLNKPISTLTQAQLDLKLEAGDPIDTDWLIGPINQPNLPSGTLMEVDYVKSGGVHGSANSWPLTRPAVDTVIAKGPNAAGPPTWLLDGDDYQIVG